MISGSAAARALTAAPHLELGGDEHGGGADQLQHLSVDGSGGQVVVDHLHGQVQGLVEQLKVLLEAHGGQWVCQLLRVGVEPASVSLTCTSTSQSTRMARISALRLGCVRM